MKYHFPLLLAAIAALLCQPLTAQLTLTTAYFPEVGDSLLTDQAPDEALAGIVFQLPGADLQWDFGTPDTRFTFTEEIMVVEDDSDFPRATSRTTSAAFDFEYYQRTDTAFNLVGLVGRLPFFRDLPLSIALDPPRPLRRAGITYGDRFESTSVRRTVVATADLPDEILDSPLGTTLAGFDSIRITSTSVRNDEVDAYGNLRLEGYDYQVLREKRVEQMETRLSLKQAGGEFFDVTAIALAVDPSYAQYLGKQPTEGTYYFWAQGIKEPVVEIEFDEAEKPKTLLFKRGGRGDITATREPVIVEVGVFPNPTTADFQLDYRLLSGGEVTVRLSDASGRAIREWRAGRQVSGAATFRGSLAGQTSGVYYLEVRTSQGSARQKIIRP